MEILIPQSKLNKIGLSNKPYQPQNRTNLLQFTDFPEYLKLVLDAVEDGITVQDPDGRIIYANKSAAKTLEYPSKDKLTNVKGEKISMQYELMDERRRLLLVEELPNRLALKSKSRAEKIICFKKKGTTEEKWSRNTSTPILDEKGNVKFIINTFKDITSQRQTHDSLGFLSEASKIFASSLDYSKTLTAIANLAVPKIADWCSIEMLNDHNQVELLAVKHIDPKKVEWAKELRRKNPTDMRSDKGIAAVIKTGKAQFIPEVTQEIIAAAAPTKNELSLIKKIGLVSIMMLPLNAGTKTIGAITFISTESKRKYTLADLYMAEQLTNRAALAIDNSRLYQNAQELAALVESSDDAIIGKSLNTAITSWNAGAERLYGYKAEEILGKPLSILFPEEKLDELSEIMEIIKMGQSVDHFETTRKAKDGHKIDVSVTVSPLKDKQGNIVGAATIARDISVSKELERRKDAFIGMASHELKTPITTIRAFIQLLQKKLKDSKDPDIKKFLQKTDEQTHKLTDLVGELLDLSKIEAGRLELNKAYINIDALTRDIIEEMRAILPSHEIILKGSAKNAKLLADKDRIGQVLINLINNAIKYSPEGNKIIIQVENNNKNVIISVQDFGIGISKDHQKRIFDRFYRAAGKSEKTFPGLGVGLYISAEIIKRHGGKIWVQSSKNNGSVFSISLPIK